MFKANNPQQYYTTKHL